MTYSPPPRPRTEEIAQKVPYLQVGTIRAIRAHVTMGSYATKKA